MVKKTFSKEFLLEIMHFNYIYISPNLEPFRMIARLHVNVLKTSKTLKKPNY